MNNAELFILDVCYQSFTEGEYTIDGDVLIDKLYRLCIEDETEIFESIDTLWEQNFLGSSNGRYFLTDKALEFLRKINLNRKPNSAA